MPVEYLNRPTAFGQGIGNTRATDARSNHRAALGRGLGEGEGFESPCSGSIRLKRRRKCLGFAAAP